MFIKYSLYNTISGQGGIPGYIDVNEIASINEYQVPDEGIQGWHRTSRGKKLCYVTTKAGMMNYSDDNFHSLAGRILEGRGQVKEAAEEFALASVAAAKKSSLSIS